MGSDILCTRKLCQHCEDGGPIRLQETDHIQCVFSLSTRTPELKINVQTRKDICQSTDPYVLAITDLTGQLTDQ